MAKRVDPTPETVQMHYLVRPDQRSIRDSGYDEVVHDNLADALRHKKSFFRETGQPASLLALFGDGSARPIGDGGVFHWYLKPNGRYTHDADLKQHKSRTGTPHAYIGRTSPKYLTASGVREIDRALSFTNGFHELEESEPHVQESLRPFMDQAIHGESLVPYLVMADYLDEHHPHLSGVADWVRTKAKDYMDKGAK